MTLEPQSHTRLRDLERQRDEARQERDDARESCARAEAMFRQIEEQNETLLRRRDELAEKWARARDAWQAIAADSDDVVEMGRLTGKAQGVDFALADLREWTRGGVL